MAHYYFVVLHLVQAIRFRTWYLIPTAVLAGTGEVIGWSGRFWSSLNGGTLQAPFLMQYAFISSLVLDSYNMPTE